MIVLLARQQSIETNTSHFGRSTFTMVINFSRFNKFRSSTGCLLVNKKFIKIHKTG